MAEMHDNRHIIDLIYMNMLKFIKKIIFNCVQVNCSRHVKVIVTNSVTY